MENEGISGWDWVETPKGNGTSFAYFRDRLLIQYLIEVEGMTYQEILNDERSGEDVELVMKNWFEKRGK